MCNVSVEDIVVLNLTLKSFTFKFKISVTFKFYSLNFMIIISPFSTLRDVILFETVISKIHYDLVSVFLSEEERCGI